MLKVMLRDPQASYELALNLLKSDISYEKRREVIRLLEAASMRKHAAASYCLGLLLLEKDSPFCDYENGLKSLLLAREQGESRASLALAQFYVPVVDCEGDVVPISHDVFLDLDKLEMSIYLQGRCAVVGDDTFPSVRLCNYIDWKPDATLKQSCLLAHRYYASIDETNLIAQFGLGMCELVIKRQIEGVPNMTALDRFTAAANGGVCAAHKLCWYILEPAVEQDARLFDKYIHHLWWLANRNDGGAVEALSMALKKRSEASGRQITDESGRDQWYWFERGASLGILNCKLEYGIRCYKTKKDDEAFSLLVSVAESKDFSMAIRAKRYLAFMYSRGWGVLDDKNKASALLLEIEPYYSDDSSVLCELGKYYLHGFGCFERNYSKALELLKKAERLGSVSAVNLLGQCYWDGHGVQKNKTVAMEHFKRAGDLGCGWGYRNYAIGLARDGEETEAERFFTRAYEMGVSEASIDMGHLFVGWHGHSIDATVAKYWFERGIESGYPESSFQLGKMLVDERDRKGIDLLEGASEAGHAESKLLLGDLYWFGVMVESDKKRALDLYKAASKWMSRGRLALAESYIELSGYGTRSMGKGIEIDPINPQVGAIDAQYATSAWKTICSLKESGDSLYLEGLCLEYGIGTQTDYVLAANRYRISSEQNVANAVCAYARCLETGKGVDADKDKAIELYKIASSEGNRYARLRLEEGAAVSSDELDELVGLEPIKREIARLRKELEHDRAREERGLGRASKCRHMLFLGGPGTGKTTVARIVARVLRESGVTKTDNVVEASRADLVGSVWGEGLKRTSEVLARAAGGVLFIDEAYSLQSERDGLGEEVVSMLTKELEDRRDSLVVIMAGYKGDMEDFFARANPGLRSRFPKTFEFPDYTSGELVEILSRMMRGDGYGWADGVLERAAEYFEREKERCEIEGEAFGNGRCARVLFERMRDARLDSVDASDPDAAFTFEPEDVPLAEEGAAVSSDELELDDGYYSLSRWRARLKDVIDDYPGLSDGAKRINIALEKEGFITAGSHRFTKKAFASWDVREKVGHDERNGRPFVYSLYSHDALIEALKVYLDFIEKS